MERRHQLVAADEVHLQRQDAEQQVAIGVVRVHGARHAGGHGQRESKVFRTTRLCYPVEGVVATIFLSSVPSRVREPILVFN